MAKGFRHDIVNGKIIITDGTATEVLGQYLTAKSRVASTVEEGDLLHAQANVVTQASLQETSTEQEQEVLSL